jgi:pyrroline-5-carboxylate reductase
MTASQHISFIGAGNMANAIIGGLIQNGHQAGNITATDAYQPQLDKVAAAFKINTTDNNNDALANADIVVLAVKPQQMQAVCEGIKATVQSQQPLIISIAAGITTGMFKQWLGENIALVRCMPNTPALVKTAASGLFATELVSEEQRASVKALLCAIGIAEWVDHETQLDAVTALSGSGPAYFFLMMEAMIDAGEKLGLSRKTAEQLCLQTALGSAKMALDSEDDVAELRRKVTSPNGTTEAAIHCFEEHKFREIVEHALNAADTRSKTLAKEMG